MASLFFCLPGNGCGGYLHAGSRRAFFLEPGSDLASG